MAAHPCASHETLKTIKKQARNKKEMRTKYVEGRFLRGASAREMRALSWHGCYVKCRWQTIQKQSSSKFVSVAGKLT
jgi:hypothetical protein